MAVDWVTFHVTDRCQLDCHHCLRDPEQTPKDLPLELVRDVLTQARTAYRSTHAVFSGGEPTLHPQFMELVDAAVELGYSWHMVTNGHYVKRLVQGFREKPSRQEALTALTISLDGPTQASHDSIRGEGSYRAVMSALSLCQLAGIPFALQMVVHQRNQHLMEEYAMTAANLGAQKVSYVQMQPTGTHHDEAFFLTADEWLQVRERLIRIRNAMAIDVVLPEGFYSEQPFYVCAAFANQQMHIDLAGQLNLCCMHAGIPREDPNAPSDIAGSLHEMSLAKAHRRLLKVIFDYQSSKAEQIEAGGLDEWDYFPCNHCLKHHSKPHWTSEGASGAKAERQRWQGAWKQRNRLPLLR